LEVPNYAAQYRADKKKRSYCENLNVFELKIQQNIILIKYDFLSKEYFLKIYLFLMMYYLRKTKISK